MAREWQRVSAGGDRDPTLAASDGAGGAIVNWQGFTVHLNMYAQT
jgi:hypothetical protein